MASNQITVKMLQRSDTNENWETINPVLGIGEIGYSTTDSKFKIGDGEKSWNELDYSNKSKVETYFEVEPNEGETDTEAITRVTTDETVEIDDMCIVKKAIAGGAYSRSAYVYSGEENGWIALDGSYDINSVVCNSDFVATSPIGVVTIPSSGSATIEAKGKTLQQVLSSIFAKENEPVATKPTCSITLQQAGAKEVGTAVTPSFTTSFNKGKYTYSDSAVVANTYTVSNGTDTKNTSTGSFDAITVGDSTNYKLTLIVAYDDDTNIPVTNVGNSRPDVAIKAGTCSATSGAITGYRSFFYGLDDTTDAIDSALIRTLTNGGAYNGKKSLTLKAADKPGVKRFIIAYPANSSRGGLSEVLLTSTMGLDITKNYVQQANVKVEGVNGYDAVDYKLFVYQPSEIGADEVHAITLA